MAVEPGVIAKVDDTDDGLGGLTVWLRGTSGVTYYYAHNAENLVVEGQEVAQGQMIARVGRTGNAATTPPTSTSRSTCAAPSPATTPARSTRSPTCSAGARAWSTAGPTAWPGTSPAPPAGAGARTPGPTWRR